MSDATVSVVIASHNASATIAMCLRALDAQTSGAPLEIILADSSTDQTPELVRRQFPGVHLLHFDGGEALAVLRGRGIAAATGGIVAILDPFSIPAPNWAAEVRAAHADLPHLVIGGSVDLHESAGAPYQQWATYLNEYGLFLPPVTRGATWILAGSNLSYKRAALFDGNTPRFPVYWKTFVNLELERGGSPLWLEPKIRVALNKPIVLRDFLKTRFRHGRCFAGLRTRDASLAVRLSRAASTPVLPALQLWRWTAAFWPKRRHRVRFVATMPVLFALFSLWAVGEACGYLRGCGRSCEQLYY